MAPAQACCDFKEGVAPLVPGMDQPFVTGCIETSIGTLPRVASNLTFQDILGSVKARWALGRMNFKVDPGLYALGDPTSESHVFVTANYKMSFDRLRAALEGINAWILVLDTKGINVWCAAGKGTFGTEELVRRIKWSGLERVVSHRTLILPQLGAPGIAAHKVKKASGFSVVFGPVASKDIPLFLQRGLKATPEMRRKDFPLAERVALVPVELVQSLRMGLLVVLVFSLLGAFLSEDGYLAGAWRHGGMALAGVLTGISAGAVATPILLPWIPGRAFSVKGALLGGIGALLVFLLEHNRTQGLSETIQVVAWALLVIAISAYLAMNFTGASTYTSLSGVKKEMKWAVPMQIGTGILGLFFLAASGLMD
jgi:acetyl-CoA decarbonylase/synthase complex subunit gamma